MAKAVWRRSFGLRRRALGKDIQAGSNRNVLQFNTPKLLAKEYNYHRF